MLDDPFHFGKVATYGLHAHPAFDCNLRSGYRGIGFDRFINPLFDTRQFFRDIFRDIFRDTGVSAT